MKLIQQDGISKRRHKTKNAFNQCLELFQRNPQDLKQCLEWQLLLCLEKVTKAKSALSCTPSNTVCAEKVHQRKFDRSFGDKVATVSLELPAVVYIGTICYAVWKLLQQDRKWPGIHQISVLELFVSTQFTRRSLFGLSRLFRRFVTVDRQHLDSVLRASVKKVLGESARTVDSLGGKSGPKKVWQRKDHCFWNFEVFRLMDYTGTIC